MNNIIAIIPAKKLYTIYFNNDEVDFGYLECGNIKKNLNTEEIKLLETFYQNIRVDLSTSYNCGEYEINGKLFKILMDSRNHKYTFFENVNGEYFIPSKKDASFLNNYYNNDCTVLSSTPSLLNGIRNNSYYKVMVSFAKKGTDFFKKTGEIITLRVFPIFLASSLVLSFLPSKTRYSLFYNLETLTYNEIKNKNEYSYSDIINAIESNEKIPQKDKKFMIEAFEEEFYENKDYINLEMLINRFKKINIKYKKKLESLYNIGTNNGGTYNFMLNELTCYKYYYSEEKYDNDLLDFDKVSERTYFHEFNHALTDYTWSSLTIAPSNMTDNFLNVIPDIDLVNKYVESNYETNKQILIEIFNEMFSKEYLEKYICSNNLKYGFAYGISYNDYMFIGYALSELLPEETLREYKFNQNESIIVNALLNIDDNFEKACELITTINTLYLYNTMSSLSNDYEIFKEYKDKYYDCVDKFYDIINFYYEKKNGYGIENDLVMLAYQYKYGRMSKEKIDFFEDYVGMSGADLISDIKVYEKGYFSNSYKEKHPCVTVQFRKRYDDIDEYITVEIDDTNRYLNSYTK